MHVRLLRPATLLLTAIAMIGAAACSSDDPLDTPLGVSAGYDDPQAWRAPSSAEASQQPDRLDRAPGAFFPLALGNRWEYDRTFETQLEVEGTLEPPETFHSTITRELTQTEELAGRVYVVEERTEVEEGETSRLWIRYRQDRAGLYEADVAATLPPATASSGRWLRAGAGVAAGPASARRALEQRLEGSPYRGAFLEAWERLESKLASVRRARALWSVLAGSAKDRPGGAESDELVRLAYPLRPGQAWTVRAEPLFASVVEAHDTLDLPAGRLPGWRIRMDSSVFGPDDEVELWYGRSGYLALHAELQMDATDENGEVIGVLHVQDSELLTDLDLATSRPSAGFRESI